MLNKHLFIPCMYKCDYFIINCFSQYCTKIFFWVRIIEMISKYCGKKNNCLWHVITSFSTFFFFFFYLIFLCSALIAWGHMVFGPSVCLCVCLFLCAQKLLHWPYLLISKTSYFTWIYLVTRLSVCTMFKVISQGQGKCQGHSFFGGKKWPLRGHEFFTNTAC